MQPDKRNEACGRILAQAMDVACSCMAIPVDAVGLLREEAEFILSFAVGDNQVLAALRANCKAAIAFSNFHAELLKIAESAQDEFQRAQAATIVDGIAKVRHAVGAASVLLGTRSPIINPGVHPK